MSLSEWLVRAWVTEHRATREEIANLLALADRDLRECEASGLSPDWRLTIAYNAALQCATAALAAAGYRAGREAHHYRVIQSLALTVGWSHEAVGALDTFRQKRHVAGYERAGAVSEREAEEMITLALRLREDVQTWLEAQHPGLV